MDPVMVGAIAVAAFVAAKYWQSRGKKTPAITPTQKAADASATGVGVNIPWIATPGGNTSGKTGTALVGQYAILGTEGAEIGIYVTGYQSTGPYSPQYAGNISWGQPALPSGVHVGDFTNFKEEDIEAVVDRATGQSAGWPTGVSVR